MKKIALFLGAAALLTTACTNEWDLRTNTEVNKATSEAIAFSSSSKNFSRAMEGADAALKLGKNFVVEAVKVVKNFNNTTDSLAGVMDNYNVNWTAQTAGTTESNTSDWEYVGFNTATDPAVAQSIKYWDFTSTSYNYAAFSTPGLTIGAGKDVEIKGIDLTGTDWADATKGAYTFTGKADKLAQCYITDMYTAYHPSKYDSLAALTPSRVKAGYMGKFQNEVMLNFRSMGTKLRIGFYEIVPGYSVKDLKFYVKDSNKKLPNETGYTKTTSDSIYLYMADAVYAGDNVDGVMTVYFPNAGAGNEDSVNYNQAYVKFAAKDPTKYQKDIKVGKPAYILGHEYKEKDDNYLGRNASQISYMYNLSGNVDYSMLLPTGLDPQELKLIVDYTLVSIDGSGEEINVTGATALVPAEFTKWQPNYAYTYIFKISDNSNGTTGDSSDPAGLYPITFDAAVVDATDGIQETITTVASPSITTYQYGKAVTNEHVAGTDIFATIEGLTTAPNYKNALWYQIDLSGSKFTVATEAAIAGTLQEPDTFSVNSNTKPFTDTANVLGRNGIKLTKKYNIKAVDSILMADGTKTKKKASQITAPAAGTYAYVYQTSTGTPDTSFIYSAELLADQPNSWAFWNVWYLDHKGQVPAKPAKHKFTTQPEDWFTATYYTDSVGKTEADPFKDAALTSQPSDWATKKYYNSKNTIDTVIPYNAVVLTDQPGSWTSPVKYYSDDKGTTEVTKFSAYDVTQGEPADWATAKYYTTDGNGNYAEVAAGTAFDNSASYFTSNFAPATYYLSTFDSNNTYYESSFDATKPYYTNVFVAGKYYYKKYFSVKNEYAVKVVVVK